MTFEQTVEIPANRRLTINIPREFPASAAILTFTPKPADTTGKNAQARLQETVKKLRNLAKNCSFSSEDLFEERRKDRALDEAQYRRLFQKG
ncbi:MAG: hypothetical protein LBK66_03830, partial [Spirochaetaceae bacterium]|jgi:hypothetical protein|nr:hypothetical protein [Spirochaetaceae bacterium]